MKSRLELERFEQEFLAPYGQRSGGSDGRDHAEEKHVFRTEYERDRARIVHSRAFRRLEYKTQVFLNGSGDHLRTRLTHTMEVASIGRTVARDLGLNEDLTEAVALAHDLGHAPFGHSGEDALNEIMREHGGFDHNAQSLRVVELLEQKYPQFPGLNLSWEVREGLHKHAKFYERPGNPGVTYFSPSLEAQVANLADEITYYSHDLEDGLEFALLDPKQLGELELWQTSMEQVRAQFPDLQGKALYGYVIRCLIDEQVQDVIETSAAAIDQAGVQSVEDVRRLRKSLIGYSPARGEANRKLRRFLYQNLYHHPAVEEVNQSACEVLESMFAAYLGNPDLLGMMTSRRLETDGLHRTVCDYLAGMTDRYVLEEHARLVGRRKTPALPVLTRLVSRRAE